MHTRRTKDPGRNVEAVGRRVADERDTASIYRVQKTFLFLSCLFYLPTRNSFNRGEGIFHVRFFYHFHAWMPQSLLRSKSTFASFSYEKCTRRNLLLMNRVTTDTRRLSSIISTMNRDRESLSKRSPRWMERLLKKLRFSLRK